jgi:hypothetical protein
MEILRHLLTLASVFRQAKESFPLQTLDSWDARKHPRDKKGRFISIGGSDNSNRRDCSDYQKIPKNKPIISSKENAMVRHELNTHLTKEERKKRIVRRCIRNAMYTVINHGFDNYEIIDKIDLN